MESSSNDDFVTLLCTNPNPTEPDAEHTETVISTTDIPNWDLTTILRFQTVRIQAHRQRLAEQCSYFRGLLGGSFSDSNLDWIPIQWNLVVFVNVLKCIYGYPVDITSDSFLSIFEAALYFGAEMLLLKCKNWFIEVSSSKEPGQLGVKLDDLIHIWNFGLEHANDFVPELCSSYLARNFMWAMSSKFFIDIPYNLLLCGIKHPYLTVYSEMHLSDALLVWLNAIAEPSKTLSKTEDDCTELLKEIQTSLLPLWFAAGKRRSCYFSEIANESIEKSSELMDIPATKLIDVLEDGGWDHLRIRLTEYSMILNLSGCPQITSAVLLLSLLPSCCMDLTLRKRIKHSLIKFEHRSSKQSRISQEFPPTLSFEALKDIDISNCARLNLEAAIECFSMSFPSLRKVKAVHLLNFKTSTLLKLVQKCPLVSEVDLTVDITPLIPSQVSVVSSNLAATQIVSNEFFSVDSHSLHVICYHSRPPLSNITRLTLEGRSDISDSDLRCIAQFCASIHYVNLKGCISVTDDGLSNLIRGSIKLKSILVCDTSFGINSVLAICSTNTISTASPVTHSEKGNSDLLAHKLQTLHMGGCNGVDERALLELISKTKILRSLCLRGTYLVDDVIYSFSGSSLETLDVSDTKISGVALSYIVSRNPSLKCLNARGCKNLIQQQSNTNPAEFSSSYVSGELYSELGKRCILEEIAVGWGFSCLSLEPLKPAIMSLRAVTVGLGGSLGENALGLLPTTCPMLETVILYFQIISDSVMMHIMTSLRHLQVLALCYCLGDISMSIFKSFLPNLRKLRLYRVAPWMTNNDLVLLTQNCANLVEFSLLGCGLLNSDSLQIISQGWPGLILCHLEDCGEVTVHGVSSLFHCCALEDILLRHNGRGIKKSFILDATLKLPLLRQVSLDICDAIEGDFDIPDYSNRHFLRTVKIARCKLQRCSSQVESIEGRGRHVHKETLALVWNSENLVSTVVKERL